MVLQPLEFSECLMDSPSFREKLHSHEKELERTSKSIKALISECKDLLAAARNLSKAQRSFSETLKGFHFETIGDNQTDDEQCIVQSLKKFSELISSIEEERDRMLARSLDQIIRPLESFRKEQIGGAKEGKKKFEKQTSKFCTSLDRYLELKSKANDSVLQEQDAALEMEKRSFYQASMQYVLLLQEVQERKKFEFVETLLGFIYGWLTFYHQGHEVQKEFKPYMTELQIRIQNTRTNFGITHEEAEQLMNKMLETRGKNKNFDNTKNSCTREGYLYLIEKKIRLATRTKYYCTYKKEGRSLNMIPYNQVTGKGINTETLTVISCTRRASDSIEKRFCFDIKVQDKASPLTLQALSEEDRRLWLDVMDGKEPIYSQPNPNSNDTETVLDDIGFQFINKCISAIESRGLTDQGLYRTVGVNSKVNKLTNMGLDRRKVDKLNLEDSKDWETKTITSALKNYFRSLPEPVMTFKLHQAFISAAKQDLVTVRVDEIHRLVHQLPEPNIHMLSQLFKHLRKVSDNCDTNLMTIQNIGVCFGPTLMRPEEETIAAIMDIKFCNIVVEILISHYELIFGSTPEAASHNHNRSLALSPEPVDLSMMEASCSSLSCELNKTPMPVPSQMIGERPRKPPLPPALNCSVPPAAAPAPLPPASPLSMRHHVQSAITETPPPSAASTASTVSSNGSSGNTAMTSSTYSNLGTSGSSSNLAQSQTYAQVRAKLKPTVGFYKDYAPVDHSSTSSSSESLNAKHQSAPPKERHGRNYSFGNSMTASAPGPLPDDVRASASHIYGNLPQASRHSQPLLSTGSGGSVKSEPLPSSSTSSVSSISSGQAAGGRRVRTLYSCCAENESELSFEPNQIIVNVRPSREPGWLEGSLEGHRGLIPANYVEYLSQH